MTNISGKVVALIMIEIIMFMGIFALGHSNWFVDSFTDYDVAWRVYHHMIIYLGIGIVIGYFTGKIAKIKGYSFYSWFLYGQFFTIFILIYVVIKFKKNIVEFFVLDGGKEDAKIG